MKAEAVLLHPDKLTIACRAKNPSNGAAVIQVFDLSNKSKIGQVELNEEVGFWTWINAEILAIVTKSSVYHLNITSAPNKAQHMFDKASQVSGAHIMGYQVNHDQTWALLYGISGADGQVNGAMQLYFLSQKK